MVVSLNVKRERSFLHVPRYIVVKPRKITQIDCGRNLIITVTKYSWARLSKLLSSSNIMLKDFQILFFPAGKKKRKKTYLVSYHSFYESDFNPGVSIESVLIATLTLNYDCSPRIL